MSRKFWTSSEERDLVEMVEDGTPLSAVAEVLGRSYGSCKCKLHVLGAGRGRTGRPYDVERTLLIISLIDVGLSIIGVARRLGVKEPSVRKTVFSLVRMGVLVRLGGATRTCRYVVTTGWKKASGRAELSITWNEVERHVLSPKVSERAKEPSSSCLNR